MMSAEPIKFRPGEFFVYINGSSWELGKVKRAADDDGLAYYCYYSSGTTAARTPVTHMHKLINGENGPAHQNTVNDLLASMDPSQQILIRDYFSVEDLYRGNADSVPLDLWHLPMEICHVLPDGCRLVEVS